MAKPRKRKRKRRGKSMRHTARKRKRDTVRGRDAPSAHMNIRDVALERHRPLFLSFNLRAHSSKNPESIRN